MNINAVCVVLDAYLLSLLTKLLAIAFLKFLVQ